MKARKTIEVDVIRREVNEFNLHSADRFKGERLGQSKLLELILHKTGNYRGFNLYNPTNMSLSKDGTSVGCNGIYTDLAANFEGTDESRVYYYPNF